MMQADRAPFRTLTVAASLLAVSIAATACAPGGQAGALTAVASSADMQPTNDLPNPYRTIEGWAKLPAGRTWGSTSAVDLDPDGTSIWVAERCGGNVGACLQNDVDPVMKFDAQGNLVRSFGRGMITWPHGIHVDRDGNVWVVDGRDNQSGPGAQTPPPSTRIGHQVIKFSPTGEVLMRLGTPGGAREPDHFWQPNDVYVAPDGSIFVAEGHSNNPQQASARMFKFDSSGRLLKQWGTMGNGPTDLMQPHSLAMDSRGRLFVADRSNNRIQIYDQEGNLLDTWYQFSRPSGVYIDANDVLYVADSESASVARDRLGWLRGIRIGSARTGEVRYLIPDPQPDCTGTCTAEGVVADRNGVVYGAEVGPVGGIKRYVRE